MILGTVNKADKFIQIKNICRLKQQVEFVSGILLFLWKIIKHFLVTQLKNDIENFIAINYGAFLV